MKKRVVIPGAFGSGVVFEYNGSTTLIEIIDGEGNVCASSEIQRKEFGRAFNTLIDAAEGILANKYRVEYYVPINGLLYTEEIEAESHAMATTKFYTQHPGAQLISIVNIYMEKKSVEMKTASPVKKNDQ